MKRIMLNPVIDKTALIIKRISQSLYISTPIDSKTSVNPELMHQVFICQLSLNLHRGEQRAAMETARKRSDSTGSSASEWKNHVGK